MTPRTRQPAPQHVLSVESTQWLGPHLVRVVLGGESVETFLDNGSTDSYVKLVFDEASASGGTEATERRPVTRTYTVRWVDRTARRLAIDFVTHGDTGLAAPWAAAAQPGDQLRLSGPGGGYAPDPDAAWHVLVGDLSALPAISAAMEAMPGTARGIAYIEITDPADIVPIDGPAAIDVHWLVNPDPADAGFLAGAIDVTAWPVGLADGVQVFAHGERESIKAVRAVFREVPRERLSISGYWARGRTEDAFQAEKREPIGKID